MDPAADAIEPSYVLSVSLQYVHSGLRLLSAAGLGAVDLSAPLRLLWCTTIVANTRATFLGIGLAKTLLQFLLLVFF